MRVRNRASLAASLALLAAATVLAAPLLVAAQTAEDPSDVVLVFDVSNSILLSTDGTNTEFADALEGIADQVAENASELQVGNAEISFVVFGRTAITYRARCETLTLHENPAGIAALERCLRDIAAEYRAGPDAPIRNRINTQDTDHVAALREAADLLPSQTTRSAVIFFTDGQHDPPGSARDDENVVDEVAAAFEGQSPLAVLPVGLGSAAGAFEDELQAIFDAYFRDMEPCEGRASFSWPSVVFAEADAAGVAVAQALQEVTCSFTFVPPPTAPPSAPPTPTPPPAPGAPLGVQLLPGDQAVTVQWLAPTEGAEAITSYRVVCTPDSGEPLDVEVDATGTLEAKIEGIPAGTSVRCEVTPFAGDVEGETSAESETVVVLGIPEAPGQPRVEPGDASARVTVDPVAGGAPAEGYFFECRDTNGAVVGGQAAEQPSAVVTGLANGRTFDCVAYAENSIGRGPASPASARFTPCGGFFDCNPWAKWGGAVGVLVAALAALAFIARRIARRNRVWITAQVDGGANLPLGWGPEIGIRLERNDDGWFASLRPPDGADIRARYRGAGRFVVTSKAGVRDVHQGDPAAIRDEAGGLHDIILRRYRDKPKERVAPAPAETKEGTQLGERIEGKDDQPPPEIDLVG